MTVQLETAINHFVNEAEEGGYYLKKEMWTVLFLLCVAVVIRGGRRKGFKISDTSALAPAVENGAR